MVNVLAADDLSSPKSNTATEGLVPPDLYIKAPLAVIEEDVQLVSEKSTNAVVPEVVELLAMVNVLPPAVYPVPDTSLVVEYAVVEALKSALEVYKAILND
jgi:hypothetical protein